MINERVMAQGSWEIRLRIDAPPNLWRDLDMFGHIVITPQQIGLGPDALGDAGVLSVARYSGVLLEKRIDESGIALGGPGMVWWLGSEDSTGDIIETKVELSSSTLDNALDQLLPSAVTKGTVDEPAGTTYTGTHQWETPLDAVRTVCAAMGAEYKILPDGTINAGPKEDVYTITTPEVVVVRVGYGSDPAYVGINVERAASWLNARPYVSRGIVTTEDSDNVVTLVGAQDRTPAPTATDLHGNTIDRVIVQQTSGAPVDVSIYLTTMMNEHAVVSNMELDTNYYEITGGDMRVGDAFWCFDPPAFTSDQDATPDEILFRGQVIWPVKLRLIAASWPVRRGMGVYYRTPEASPSYIDLSPYVEFEEEEGGIEVIY